MAKNTEQAESERLAPVMYTDCPLEEHGTRTFAVRVKKYHTVPQLEDPKLWENVADKFEMFTRLNIHALDGSMFARALVVHVRGSQARVKVLDHYDLDRVMQDEIKLSGHIIRNLGKADGWTITLESTGEVVADKMPDQASCINYLQDQEKAA